MTRTCLVLAIDPGVTSGVCVVGIDSRWLLGEGPPTWEGLGKAVTFRYAAQIGRHPKLLDEDGKSRGVSIEQLEEQHLPVQPFDDDSTAKFLGLLSGDGPAAGGDLTTLTANEVRQVRQIAGLLEIHPRAALVMEGFTLRQMNSKPELLSPERLAFAIQTNDLLHGSAGRIGFKQQPSYVKGTATDERLRRSRLYLPGMVHATDAMRHVATFARDCRSRADLRTRAWPRHFNSE